MGLNPEPMGTRFRMEKLTSSLVTLMRKVAKNPGLLGSWEDLKTRILNLDFMDGL